MLQTNHQMWIMIIGCTIVVYLIAVVLGNNSFIDIAGITAFTCLLGILLNWRRNRHIALGFLGSLISIFVVVPSIILLATWLILRTAHS